MIKVFIAPGWSEGDWQRRRFAKAFTNDLALTDIPDEADVVVAHSAGCYSLPKVEHAKLVMLINPPYYPGRPLIKCIIQNVILDVPEQINSWGIRFWLRLRLHNWLFGLAHPAHHIHVSRSIRKTLQLAVAESSKTIVVRNGRDSFSGEALRDYAKDFEGAKYIKLPGLHEDCWRNPKPYVDIILKEL